MGGEQSKPKKSSYLKDFPDAYRLIKNTNSQPYGPGTVYVRIDNPS